MYKKIDTLLLTGLILIVVFSLSFFLMTFENKNDKDNWEYHIANTMSLTTRIVEFEKDYYKKNRKYREFENLFAPGFPFSYINKGYKDGHIYGYIISDYPLKDPESSYLATVKDKECDKGKEGFILTIKHKELYEPFIFDSCKDNLYKLKISVDR